MLWLKGEALRPLRDRILFAAWNGRDFILLHWFVKQIRKRLNEKLNKPNGIWLTIGKGAKAMRGNRKYARAMAQAKDNLADLRERGSQAASGDALAFMETILTPEEIAQSDLRVALIGEFIKARQEKGISQKKLEELSGVKQPVIARLEKGATSPQIDTVLKLLAPLGKTLAIVPIDESRAAPRGTYCRCRPSSRRSSA